KYFRLSNNFAFCFLISDKLELLLEGDKIYPGRTKWGAPERLRAFETGIGTF
ncbi:unnamed protein product, partial [marine sediment metagenome]